MIATEDDPTGLPIPLGLHTTFSVIVAAKVDLRKRGIYQSPFNPIDMDAAEFTLDGALINWREYAEEWAKQVVDKDVLMFPSGRLEPGEYQREAVSKRSYEPSNLLVNGHDIESAELHVDYKVMLYRPAVLSSFDIESRGRVLSLFPITLPTGQKFLSGVVQQRDGGVHIWAGLPEPGRGAARLEKPEEHKRNG